ncbi:DUF4177 domain-containing protein [Bacillus licheniformis]|jgi:hypothetical protein|uniref:DUF4177 domain-containing protein n=2 Tax=Bacillus licheniformis TaxID=1402 RepID=Q65DC8_BACLD|nr:MULTISPECIES: DUF4177 domain-containing protein [Bacillus]MBJ7887651.1 DUF4177 domain-containing protein [Bacillaceae bacterium HSR45]MBY8348476.1 DUF4177 domain-containing protein [Bacillus sp. PCH94]MDP4079879.1 DUF4177 domain-containing protein [Bacillota bacterium]AAU25562.1 conserved hypothetical protein [Bacillus licheniformis DSM 13 = ATCC 14580]AAU42936.1 LanX [Bacillus licheniformis DSM 13 = ATCC 14580]
MYEYQTVSIAVGAFNGKLEKNYSDVIHEYAEKGWKLHSVFSVPSRAGGQVSSIELIFEKPKS